MWTTQHGFDVRFEWGLVGALALADHVEVAVVVDVLSFSTTVSVALDLGVTVYPHPWATGAADLAAEKDAVLAVGRSRARPGDISLSPASLRAGTPPARIVLPSPNGATIAHALAGRVPVAAACLRNAEAVAAWVGTRTVAVIAAGEKWPDGSLRPSVEDLWGASAVIHHLSGTRSPEVPDEQLGDLCACASGRELVAGGFGIDVDIAGEVGASRFVPVLQEGAFTAAQRSE